MKAIFLIVIMIALAACTYSITMIHTEGSASDVVDDTDTVSPTTSVTLPVGAIP